MPPVWAAAFNAEFLGIPYYQVAIVALFPAILIIYLLFSS
jgi:TRAP-type uncharacterized transport system fused permease subunit